MVAYNLPHGLSNRWWTRTRSLGLATSWVCCFFNCSHGLGGCYGLKSLSAYNHQCANDPYAVEEANTDVSEASPLA